MRAGVFVFAIFVLSTMEISVAQQEGSQTTWPQFRGPKGAAIAKDQEIPFEFTDGENTLWKIPVPLGSSSPIVWDKRIFLTGHDDRNVMVLCYDRATGGELWRKTKPSAFAEDYLHEDCSPAAATSCTDGQRVISFFGTFGLIAHDFSGNELWQHRIQNRSASFGSASSPILYGNRVFFLRDTAEYSALLCLDAQTGEEVWKAERNAFTDSFSTPFIWEFGESSEVVVAGSGALDSYDCSTGRKKWTVTGLPAFICPSPVAKGDRLVFGAWTTAHVAGAERTRAGFGTDLKLTNEESTNASAFIKRFDKDGSNTVTQDELPESRSRDAFLFLDHDKSGSWDESEIQSFFDKEAAPGRNILVAVRGGGSGDVTQTHVLWESGKNLPYVASPLIHKDRVYCLKKGGLLTSWELSTGKMDRPMRLGIGGEFYATPVAIGEILLIAAERGAVIIVSVADKHPEIVAENDFDESIFATPAVVDNKIYLRTAANLYAFGNEK